MKDVSKETMAELIKYMYTGEVQVEQDTLNDFLNAAKSLAIKGATDDSFLEQRSSSFSIRNQSTHDIIEYRSSQINRVYGSSDDTYGNSRQPAINKTQYENDYDYDHSNDGQENTDNGMNNGYNSDSYADYTLGNCDASTDEQFAAAAACDDQWNIKTSNANQSVVPVQKRIKRTRGQLNGNNDSF